MAEQVLVFPSGLLPPLPPQAFFSDDPLLERLLTGSFFMDRSRAESDPTFKQIIPYAILRCGDAVLSYRRTRAGSEGRLHDLYSIGVGGHINPLDSNGSDPRAALLAGRDREVAEEFAFEPAEPPRLAGLLNDTHDPVSLVHFGVVYEYRLVKPVVYPGETGKHAEHSFLPLAELAAHLTRYEGWSQIVINHYLCRAGC